MKINISLTNFNLSNNFKFIRFLRTTNPRFRFSNLQGFYFLEKRLVRNLGFLSSYSLALGV